MKPETDDLSVEVAYKVINSKLDEAKRLIKECEQIATEYDVSFGWDVAYGMGGTYDPTDGWISSSQNC